MLRTQIYSRDGSKRVPIRVLNAPPWLQESFLAGYNAGDGLKAGNGTDPFKSFRTTSPHAGGRTRVAGEDGARSAGQRLPSSRVRSAEGRAGC